MLHVAQIRVKALSRRGDTADVMRRPRGAGVFDLQPTGWIPLFYAPHPICGGWTQVPVYILQRLYPGYFESKGAAS